MSPEAPARANASIRSRTSRWRASSSAARARSSAMTIASPMVAARSTSGTSPAAARAATGPGAVRLPPAAQGRMPAPPAAASSGNSVSSDASMRRPIAGQGAAGRFGAPRSREPRAERQRFEPGTRHRTPLAGGRVGTQQNRGGSAARVERDLVKRRDGAGRVAAACEQTRDRRQRGNRGRHAHLSADRGQDDKPGCDILCPLTTAVMPYCAV